MEFCSASVVQNNMLCLALMTRLLTGFAFSLGLILVVVGGAELFTGNNLIVMAWANGKVTGRVLLRNWIIVYLGNFVGSIGTVVLMFLTKQYTFGANSVGIAALQIGVAKVDLIFIQAVALGIPANGLVCLAVWLTYSARSTIDKIFAIIFPITAFVASGFEHSIANMYFIPYALFIKDFDPKFVAAVGDKVPHLDLLTWQAFLVNNLIPVTIGNIIGGAVLVAAVYWAVFLRTDNPSKRRTHMKAYVLIKIRAGNVKEVVCRLHETPHILEASMTLGPYDAIAVVEADDLGGLGKRIACSIQPMPGVEQTLTCLAVEV